MADGATRQATADIRLWDGTLRRQASLGVLIAAGVVVVLGVLFYGVFPGQAGWFLILAIVLLALMLLFEAAVVATGIAREEGIGPTWLNASDIAPLPAHAPGPRGEPDEMYERIDLKCPECGNIFSAPDTGERPLHTTCPHCGAEGHVDGLPEPTPVQGEAHTHDHGHEHHEHDHAAYAPPGGSSALEAELDDSDADASESDVEAEVISLKCPACATKFSVEDTGERPLKATCPGCGRSGRLR